MHRSEAIDREEAMELLRRIACLEEQILEVLQSFQPKPLGTLQLTLGQPIPKD
jgi:hypothetical protein